jgi:hypothetical protein
MTHDPETENGEDETGGPFTITEVDEDDRPTIPIDLNEYRKKLAYEEFWSDPCWKEPLDPSPNGS